MKTLLIALILVSPLIARAGNDGYVLPVEVMNSSTEVPNRLIYMVWEKIRGSKTFRLATTGWRIRLYIAGIQITESGQLALSIAWTEKPEDGGPAGPQEFYLSSQAGFVGPNRLYDEVESILGDTEACDGIWLKKVALTPKSK